MATNETEATNEVVETDVAQPVETVSEEPKDAEVKKSFPKKKRASAADEPAEPTSIEKLEAGESIETPDGELSPLMADREQILGEEQAADEPEEEAAAEGKPAKPAGKKHTVSKKIVSMKGQLHEANPERLRLDADKQRTIDICESLMAKTPLTGVVCGCEKLMIHGKPMFFAAVMYGKYKVRIPATKFCEIPPDLTAGKNESQIRYLYGKAIQRRMLSEVDFIVTHDMSSDGYVLADRLKAMEHIRMRSYFGLAPNGYKLGKPKIEVGSIAEGRVVFVGTKGIIVDVHGAELKIPRDELTYEHIWDATDIHRVGDVINVKILTLDTKADGYKVEATASAKQSRPNPRREKIMRYEIDNLYMGEVVNVDTHHVWVHFEKDVDIACPFPDRCQRPSIGDRVCVRISGKVMDKLWLQGWIVSVF